MDNRFYDPNNGENHSFSYSDNNQNYERRPVNPGYPQPAPIYHTQNQPVSEPLIPEARMAGMAKNQRKRNLRS